MTATIDVEGMSCGGCEETVREAQRGVPAVTEAEVDREHGIANVAGEADAQALVTAIEDAGYDATARARLSVRQQVMDGHVSAEAATIGQHRHRLSLGR